MLCKYIIFKNGNVPLIFPREPLTHLQIAINRENVKSAGFCKFNIVEDKIKVTCFGGSSTLEIEGNPVEDKKIIENFILNKY